MGEIALLDKAHSKSNKFHAPGLFSCALIFNVLHTSFVFLYDYSYVFIVVICIFFANNGAMAYKVKMNLQNVNNNLSFALKNKLFVWKQLHLNRTIYKQT